MEQHTMMNFDFIKNIIVVLFFSFTYDSMAMKTPIEIDERLKTMKGKELVELGVEYERRSLVDSALLCFAVQANKRFWKSTDQDSMEVACCANALYHIGLIYNCEYSNYQRAYSYYRLAEEYALAHGFFRIIPVIHSGMAGLSRLEMIVLRNPNQAINVLKNYQRIFHDAEKYKLYGLLGVVAKNMASVAKEWNLVDSVKTELLHYCNMRTDSMEFYIYDNRLFCKAIVESECNQDKDFALQLLDEALKSEHFKGGNEDSNDSIVSLITKVQLLGELGRNKEALQVIEKIVEISKRIDNHVSLHDMYKCLFSYYNDKGDERKAQVYELLYLREKDFIEHQCKLSDIRNVKFLYEIEKLEDSARVQADRERMMTYMIYWALVVAFILICMLVWILKKYQQTQAKNLQLYQKNNELLEAHVLEVKRLEEQVVESKGKNKQKYQKSPMGEESKQDLMHRVFLVLEKSDEVLKPNFTLDRLAELVDANPTYVSYVINEKRQCNFNVLLNEYRIKEACRRMNDYKQYGHLTIEGIAASVGIKSRTNFSANFKKITGLTPSEYQRLARKNQG